MVLRCLPADANGKVDRRAFPPPDLARPELETPLSPRVHPLKRQLAGMWAKILRVERVGIHDNFFELGGDSILSVQIIAKANQAGLRLTPRQVFQHQTIAELAAVADMAPAMSALEGPVTGRLPLTPIQHWFFEHGLVDVHHFNQAVLLQVQHVVSPVLIEQALQHMLRHHDALRLRYRQTATGWSQEIVDPDVAVPFCHIDMSALAETEHDRVIEAVTAALQGSLHLMHGPLVRVAFFTLGKGQPDRLLLIIHHLAVDGASWRLLLTDLQEICEYLRRGEPIQPVENNLLQTWAERLRTHVQSAELQQELDYWRPCSTPWSAACLWTILGTKYANSARSTRVSSPLRRPGPSGGRSPIIPALTTCYSQRWRRPLAVDWCPGTALDVEGHGREAASTILICRVRWAASHIFPVLLELDAAAMPDRHCWRSKSSCVVCQSRHWLRFIALSQPGRSDLPDPATPYPRLRCA